MKSIPVFVIILLTLLPACQNNPTEKKAASAENTENDNTYLPVTDFIRNDINRVDSFAGGILRKVNGDIKKDSGFIPLSKFHRLASRFLLPELDSASFKEQFTENSLMDETTQLVNFIYNTTNPDLSLKKVIVYIKPSLSVDNVERIYMEKDFMQNDTLVQEKMTWKLNEFFYTISIRKPKEGPAVTTIEKVIWDPRKFEE